MLRALITSLTLILILSSCGNVKRKLTITAYSPGSDSHNAALALEQILEEEGWKITIVSQSHLNGIEAVREGNVDLAITSNDISIDPSGLRTVMPLYHEVITILLDKESKVNSLRTLSDFREYLKSEKPKILFSEKDSYAHLIAERLLRTQGVYPDDYEAYYFTETMEEYDDNKVEMVRKIKPDAIYLVGTEDNGIVHSLMQEGYDFGDADDQYDNVELSSTTSFANKMARCFPTVIPTYAFSIYQDHPILTLGIYTSLITNSSMDDATTYELAREIVNAFPQLITTNSSFVDLKENFNRKLLNYKLHAGSRNYFDRDKPSFFERYAEMSGVIFSMFVVTITFFVSMNRVIKQRKKDRIDVFYADAQNARHEDPETGLANLQALEDKAFNQLISERLSADASFVVFMQLLNEIREELKEKSNV